MAKFQKNNNMGSKELDKRTKIFTETLRHLVIQPVGKKAGLIGNPKAPTALQMICIKMVNMAIQGDMCAAEMVMNRIDGRVAPAVQVAEFDVPEQKTREITLKEAARRIGFLLLSQQPDPEPVIVEH